MAEAKHKSTGSDDGGIFDDAKTYYASDERHRTRFGPRNRTYSQVGHARNSCIQWVSADNAL